MALGDLVKSAAKGFVDSAIGSLLGGGGGPREGFSAQNIVSALSKSGAAHSGHFEVQITSNPKLGISNFEKDMIFRVEAAELPGRTMATADTRFDNYGPMQKVVTGQTYVDTTLTFLLSEDLREKDYFERWQNGMVGTGAGEDTSWYVADQTLGTGRGITRSKHNVRYFHDYIGSITIRQYGADGTLRSTHILEEAFPLQLGAVQMSWSDEGFAKMNIMFHYKKYKAVFYNQDQAKKGISGGFSLGPGGLSGSLSIPGIGSFNAGSGRFGANLRPLVGGISKKIFG
jgi:hypothetical protein